jgi:tetratricopeptide (TPR) repeat protein
MIPYFLLAAGAATAPTATEQKFDACISLINADAKQAIAYAGDWQIQSGGIPAAQCLGLAYAAQGRWLPAMTAFEHAAQLAERSLDGRAANLWVQTGNAALAGGDAEKGRIAFDAALATGAIKGTEAGEVYLDRARAQVALRDTSGARLSLNEAQRLVPADPLVWLLSATLARREGDLARAETDISEAARRSPDDASVALEAGNIAMAGKAPAAARTAWEAAVRLAPVSPAGKAAAAALKQFEVAPAE